MGARVVSALALQHQDHQLILGGNRWSHCVRVCVFCLCVCVRFLPQSKSLKD